MRAALFSSFALASAGPQNLTHVVEQQEQEQEHPHYLQQEQEQPHYLQEQQQEQQAAAFGTLHVGDLSVEALDEHHPHVGVANLLAMGRSSGALEQEVQHPGTQLIRRSLLKSVQEEEEVAATQATCVERELLSDNEEIVNAAPALPYQARGLFASHPPSPATPTPTHTHTPT